MSTKFDRFRAQLTRQHQYHLEDEAISHARRLEDLRDDHAQRMARMAQHYHEELAAFTQQASYLTMPRSAAIKHLHQRVPFRRSHPQAAG